MIPATELARRDPDPERDPFLGLDLDNERNPRRLSTNRSRSGDVPESESRLRCFASTGSIRPRTDGVLVPVLIPEGGVVQR